MVTAVTDPDLLDRVFHSLPAVDRMEVLTLGAAFHRLTLEKRLERAHGKVQAMENRYGTTLEQLEIEGLSNDADFTMHEDYVEWRYWRRMKLETEKALEVLSLFASPAGPD